MVNHLFMLTVWLRKSVRLNKFPRKFSKKSTAYERETEIVDHKSIEKVDQDEVCYQEVR